MTTASTSSIDGLVSGLNTTQVISQLMQAESAPKTLLQKKVTAETSVVTAYQGVNTNMSALLTAAQTLATGATWQAVTATSSSAAISATAGPGATPGDVAMHVTSLAHAQASISGTPVSATDTTVFGGFPFTIHDAQGNVTATITPTDGSITALVTAINNATAAGVKAAAVQVASGQYRLQLTSTKTGASGAFSIAGLTGGGGVSTMVPASDASVHIGPASGGYDTTSSTNTFANVFPGLTFTATQENADATVTVVSDSSGLAAKVQSVVDAANTALGNIASATAYNAATKSGGVLQGDQTVMGLQQSILNVVSQGLSGGKSLAAYGIQLTSDGKITFDQTTFTTAYGADPAGTQSALSTGFAQKMQDVAKAASDSSTGSITAAINGRNSEITDLNNQITSWTTRLAAKQLALQTMFSNMEVALGTLKNQSSWLTGQIAGLPTTF